MKGQAFQMNGLIFFSMFLNFSYKYSNGKPEVMGYYGEGVLWELEHACCFNLSPFQHVPISLTIVFLFLKKKNEIMELREVIHFPKVTFWGS